MPTSRHPFEGPQNLAKPYLVFVFAALSEKFEGFYQTLLLSQVCDNVLALRGALIPFCGEMLNSVDRRQSRFVSVVM